MNTQCLIKYFLMCWKFPLHLFLLIKKLVNSCLIKLHLSKETMHSRKKGIIRMAQADLLKEAAGVYEI